LKKVVFTLLGLVNKILYRRVDVKSYGFSVFYILKIGIFQKILGFNRHVPWPVHWSSTITMPENIAPGTRTPGLSKNCHIDGRNGIVFGMNVWVGPNVKIISMNHDVNNYTQFIKCDPIIIGDNCWIGAGAIILPKVKLGDHTVVAAGAIVTKSFEDGNQIIGGSPARVLKKLPEYGALNE